MLFIGLFSLRLSQLGRPPRGVRAVRQRGNLMAFKTDHSGLAFKCSDIKLATRAGTWGTRLSQLKNQNGTARIITYSLPRIEYVKEQLERRPGNIYLIAHEKFQAQAQAIKSSFPRIEVAVHRGVHSKVLLIEPVTIWISSANFGDNGWHETTIGLHSKDAHDWYVENMFKPFWDECTMI